ncbi:MAG: sulfotransferase family 2 domain-containing protein [Gammaproteobacteria bacterium]|nr:sulfotransferase family 2 domain-containing protein [Gammaproteobacteria bacterium]
MPRTGTHAIRTALGPVLGDGDWQQQSLTARVRLPVTALARFNHGHLTLSQVQANLPPTVWREYFKFAFVRNPYDRFVSVCAMLNKRNPDYRGRETAFMKRALMIARFRQRVLVRPQVDMLADETGTLGMDYVGRYETLREGFGEVCRQIGIGEIDLERSNVSEHDEYASYYDDELLAAVTTFYRRDFEAFGYETA